MSTSIRVRSSRQYLFIIVVGSADGPISDTCERCSSRRTQQFFGVDLELQKLQTIASYLLDFAKVL